MCCELSFAAPPLDGTSPRAKEGKYTTCRPGSTVGALEIEGDLSVLIEPKIGIPQLLSLACPTLWTCTSSNSRQELFDFQEAETLPDMHWHLSA